jgi:hypothetical protein
MFLDPAASWPFLSWILVIGPQILYKCNVTFLACAYSELSNIAVLEGGSSRKKIKNQSILSSSLFFFGRMKERRSQKSHAMTALTGFVNQRIMWMVTEDVEDEIEGFI